MADFDSSLPVRTQTDGDVKAEIKSGASADKWTINSNKEGLVHDQDALDKLTDIEAILSGGASSSEKHIYATTVAGVPNTPNTVISDTATALKTFTLKKFFASGSGKFKVELKTGTPASEVTRAVGFNSTSLPNVDVVLPSP